jgi:hypothetical protein
MEDETLPKQSKPRNRSIKREAKVNSQVDVQNQGDGRVVVRMVVPVGSEDKNMGVNEKTQVLKRAVQALVKAHQDGLMKKAQMKKAHKKTQKQNKYKSQRAGKKMTPKATKKSQTVPKVKKKKMKKKRLRTEVKKEVKKGLQDRKDEKRQDAIQEKIDESQTERELRIMAKRIQAISLKQNSNSFSESFLSRSLFKSFGLDWEQNLQGPTLSDTGSSSSPTGFFLAPSRLDSNLTNLSIPPPVRALNSEVGKFGMNLTSLATSKPQSSTLASSSPSSTYLIPKASYPPLVSSSTTPV